ncbi:MAG: hypothetical protein ACRC9G_11865, partial [Aeromonas veronii]
GIRAIAITLITYQDKRKANDGSRIDSVREVVERWAPSFENNTQAYANSVAALLEGVGPDDEVIDVHNFDHLRPIVEGIIRHENGRGPLKTENSWYTAAQIEEGLRRAGVVKKATAETKAVAALPAAAVGGVGLDQMAQVLPSVMAAVDNAKVDLTSGNVIQLALGAFAIGAAVFLAWQQYRKMQAGAA